jgi:hypothetical protein
VTGLYSGSATYASGDQFTIIFPNANTGTTPTINISSEGAKTIVDNKGDPVAAGDVEGILKLAYDGTNFRIVGGTGSGGVSTEPDGDKGDVTVASSVWTIDNLSVTNAKINDVAVGKITGLGTGVGTALGVNVGSAGAPVVNGAALGTPSSGNGANITGIVGTNVANTPAGGIAATTSQAAINELDTEKSPLAGSASLTTTGTLTSGTTGTGFTLSFTNSTLSGRIAAANLPLAYVNDAVTTTTTGGTITLDMNSQIQRVHIGSASFASAKATALSNITNSRGFVFFFEVTNVAAVLTPPSDWLMPPSDDWDGTDWTPPATGKYVMVGTFDGTNWMVTITQFI